MISATAASMRSSRVFNGAASASETPAGRGSDQFPLRFPDGMRDEIRLAADKNGRSINAEIIHRLELTLSMDEQSSYDGAPPNDAANRPVRPALVPKAPSITIQVEALPEGELPVQVNLLQFMQAFSKALRTEPASETSEVERQDPGPKLLSPDELDTSNDD